MPNGREVYPRSFATRQRVHAARADLAFELLCQSVRREVVAVEELAQLPPYTRCIWCLCHKVNSSTTYLLLLTSLTYYTLSPTIKKATPRLTSQGAARC